MQSGEEALERLRMAEPPLFLGPSSELSVSARAASSYLFSSLLPYSPKTPFDALLVDENFDAEQIWSQIELLYRPLLSSLRREVKRLECVEPVFSIAEVKKMNGEEDEMEEEDGEDDENEEEEEEREIKEVERKEMDDDDDLEEDEYGKGDEKERGVEDKFLKIKELEEFLEDDEEREYGFRRKKRTKGNTGTYISNKNGGMDEDDVEGDEDDVEFGNLDTYDDEDSEDERYEDFFGGKMKRLEKRKDGVKKNEDPDESKELLDEEEKDIMDSDLQNHINLSTHEKELLKINSKIKEMEKANLEPKMWTMQGEVTAKRRPKNSALEVDLDFEHNIRPPPVITEEMTISIEDIIKRRIIEGRFDDVQRIPDLRSKAPKENKDMDETKSKKGLAEIYEEEYAEKACLTAAPFSDDERNKKTLKELNSLLFEVDGLSHFMYAPKKPVIEEMSIPANVPALVMEEIAPVAVSDASMLAPEEVFKGKGNLKEEAELTQSDRKRRRANKKRRFKGEQSKRDAHRTRQKTENDLRRSAA